MSFVTEPVYVSSMVIDPSQLPDWKDILLDLPIGTGLKGGIARKILKVVAGLKRHHPDFAAEMDGNGDIDLLIAAHPVTNDLRLRLRKQFAGTSLGGMTLEPKDIEVKDDMSRYFATRDITMNEALIFRKDSRTLVLYWTEQAESDVINGIIRPAIHCLHSGFAQVWQYDSFGKPVPTPKVLSRCVIRWLKGHGVTYGIDSAVWSYYQTRGLKSQDIWRIFKHFIDDDEMFERCCQHLVTLGLLDRHVDPVRLWGKALFDVNEGLARHGQRLTLNEPNVEAIERWIARKEAEYRQWEFGRASKQALGLPVEPDECAPVFLPDGLTNFPSWYVGKGRAPTFETCSEVCFEKGRENSFYAHSWMNRLLSKISPWRV